MGKQKTVKKEKKKKDRSHLIIMEEPLGGMTSINIFRLLWQNKFRVHPKYWLRFWWALFLSRITRPLRIIEFMTKNRKIKKTEVTTDPLFIVGHYRTGTTYLITLLSHDKSKGYVSNLEAYAPHYFLTFEKFTTWILELSMPETRPMDDVVMGADEPTEEEYAIGATDKYGFYNGFIFPKNFELYSKYNSFDQCEPKDFERWQKRYDFFIKKMTYKYEGKMLFLKNPANTYRIPTLLKMYPNAKFVHIYRNPYDMYASTLKFYQGVFAIYALQTWKDEDLQQGVLDNYAEMYVKFNEDRNLIPKENLIEIQYEDFIKNPIKHVEKIYKDFCIDGFNEYKGIFEKYIKSQATYKPNVHKISDDIIERVNTHWDFVRDQHGYEKLEPEGSK